MYLNVHSDGLSNIADIAAPFNISKNHLVKVVHHLAKIGLIDSVRGRGGGIRLAQRPEEIRIGNVVRQSEQTLFNRVRHNISRRFVKHNASK